MVGSRCLLTRREREESLLLRYRIDRPHSGGGGDRLGSPVRIGTSVNDPLDETTPGEYLENVRVANTRGVDYWTIQLLRLLRKNNAQLRSFSMVCHVPKTDGYCGGDASSVGYGPRLANFRYTSSKTSTWRSSQPSRTIACKIHRLSASRCARSAPSWSSWGSGG